MKYKMLQYNQIYNLLFFLALNVPQFSSEWSVIDTTSSPASWKPLQADYN